MGPFREEDRLPRDDSEKDHADKIDEASQDGAYGMGEELNEQRDADMAFEYLRVGDGSGDDKGPEKTDHVHGPLQGGPE